MLSLPLHITPHKKRGNLVVWGVGREGVFFVFYAPPPCFFTNHPFFPRKRDVYRRFFFFDGGATEMRIVDAIICLELQNIAGGTSTERHHNTTSYPLVQSFLLGPWGARGKNLNNTGLRGRGVDR